MRYLVVSCLCVLLFAFNSYAQDYRVNERVQLVERDFGIPAHPGPGKVLDNPENSSLSSNARDC